MNKILIAALSLCLPVAAQAHEVWIERDGNGPARIYLGEPAQALPPGGDPEFGHLKAPTLIGATPALVRKAGFIEAAVPAGDVHAWDDAVFAPWGPEGKKEAVVYYARAGRATPATRLPFEIAPATANAARFIVTRDGQPAAAAEVTLIDPARHEHKLVTDAAGAIDIPTPAKGRYLLTAAHKDGPATIGGVDAAVVHRITTTSFVVR